MDTVKSLLKEAAELDVNVPQNWIKLAAIYKRLSEGYKIIYQYSEDTRTGLRYDPYHINMSNIYHSASENFRNRWEQYKQEMK